MADQVEMSLLHHGFAELSISFNQSSPRYPDGSEKELWNTPDEGRLASTLEFLTEVLELLHKQT